MRIISEMEDEFLFSSEILPEREKIVHVRDQQTQEPLCFVEPLLFRLSFGRLWCVFFVRHPGPPVIHKTHRQRQALYQRRETIFRNRIYRTGSGNYESCIFTKRLSTVCLSFFVFVLISCFFLLLSSSLSRLLHYWSTSGPS